MMIKLDNEIFEEIKRLAQKNNIRLKIVNNFEIKDDRDWWVRKAVRIFLNAVFFNNLLIRNKLSEKLLEYISSRPEALKHFFFWWHVAEHQTLSEDFMRRFEKQLNWRVLAFHQKMSAKFMTEFSKYNLVEIKLRMLTEKNYNYYSP